jgi:hypothetical protein
LYDDGEGASFVVSPLQEGPEQQTDPMEKYCSLRFLQKTVDGQETEQLRKEKQQRCLGRGIETLPESRMETLPGRGTETLLPRSYGLPGIQEPEVGRTYGRGEMTTAGEMGAPFGRATTTKG